MAKSGKPKSFESTVAEFLDRFNIVTSKDLDELKKSIETLNKKIDRAIGTKQRKGSQITKTKQSRKSTIGKRRAPKGKLGERVVQAMGSNGEFTFQNIKDKTGMDERQLRNVIFKLSRENIIKKPRRGIYSLHT
jgi:Fic family protein